MQEFFWADKVVDDIIKRKKKEYVCEGMWTPSGFFHIGNARSEIFTPYAVYKTLKDRGLKVRQNFILDDFDGLRKIPSGLGIKEEDYDKFLDKPCYLAPSPVKGHKTWAEFFVSKALEGLEEFGFDLNVISAYETYKAGKFNDLIKFSLNHSKELAGVWSKIAGAEKDENFLPIQALCSKCKGILSTEVYSWDGEKISYKCKCGNNKKVEPYNGRAKLHWRVHWAAHWILHGVDFESGGKDHFSRGGSVDVGRAFMKEVFKKEPPVQFPTEFILLFGKKISGSKGNIISLKQWSEVAPPEAFRFMNFSYKPQSAIEFGLSDNNFLLLLERYERAERIYYGLEKAENEKLESKLTRSYKLSQIKETPKKISFQLPYSFAVQVCQLVDFEKNLGEVISILNETGHIKGKPTKEELEKLVLLLRRAKFWIDNYAPDNYKLKFLGSYDNSLLGEINPEIKEAVKKIVSGLGKAKTPEEIQELIFNSSKDSGAKPKEVFKVLYLAMIGADSGPKIGTLVFVFGKEKVKQRLEETLSTKALVKETEQKISLPGEKELKEKLGFEVSQVIREKFPSFRIGLVIAENLDNKTGSKEITALLREQEKKTKSELEGTELSSMPNIKLWREAYSSFGAKPKKYKSSIEALIRRVIKGEELPEISPLVNLYNYLSIKHLLPAGGDDITKTKGKIKLVLATGKEEFVMLGSDENDSPKEGEVVYKDDKGVLCRRWNWRECDRTKLTEDTKKAVIYIESLNKEDNLEQAVTELARLTEKYCKAKTTAFVL